MTEFLFLFLKFLAMQHGMQGTDLSSLTRIKPIIPAVEARILTTGPPGKSWHVNIRPKHKTFSA